MLTIFVGNQIPEKMEMKHLVIPIVITILLLSCNGTEDREQQSLAEISKQELATALNERDQLLSLVKEVAAGLDEIKQLENAMSIASKQPAENAGQKARILAEIAGLKERIRQRKAQLQELEAKLENSTINQKELHETIDALRRQMDSQLEEIESLRRQLTAANEHIWALNDTVDSLNTTVFTVSGERDAAQETSVRLENELNVCYYVIASKADLKRHNIIESGFLRKTKLMKGEFDKGFFETSDKRVLTTLPLPSSKGRILTNHPESSYELVESNGLKTLEITDPARFWSLTNYLVIQID